MNVPLREVAGLYLLLWFISEYLVSIVGELPTTSSILWSPMACTYYVNVFQLLETVQMYAYTYTFPYIFYDIFLWHAGKRDVLTEKVEMKWLRCLHLEPCYYEALRMQSIADLQMSICFASFLVFIPPPIFDKRLRITHYCALAKNRHKWRSQATVPNKDRHPNPKLPW